MLRLVRGRKAGSVQHKRGRGEVRGRGEGMLGGGGEREAKGRSTIHGQTLALSQTSLVDKTTVDNKKYVYFPQNQFSVLAALIFNFNLIYCHSAC